VSLFTRSTPADYVAERTGRRTSNRRVSRDSAMRHSVVWACLHLRADLISTMPWNGFRQINGINVESNLPKFFAGPSDRVDFQEWMYNTQTDLDSAGNTVGLITARDGAGRASQIELFPEDELSIKMRGSKIIEYRVGGEVFKGDAIKNIWHERQFTRSGMQIGLSPIAHAALSLSTYLSAQEFAADWFAGGGVPTAHLKNEGKTLNPEESQVVKSRFKASVSTGDVFVSGKDWTYSKIAATASESAFIESMESTGPEVCRFLGVPADMVDVSTGSGRKSLTYANITQRNLQLLIINLNPPIRRRENTFSRELLPSPRVVKANRGALLEMDLKSRYEAHKIAIDSRWLAPSEVRQIEDREPFTPAQIAEFSTLFSSKQSPAKEASA